MSEVKTKGSAPLIAPDRIFNQSTNNEIPITVSKWIVRSFQTFLVTGDQGCGKTTYLKSIVRYYPLWAALRVNEIQPELNLRYAYPNRNIVSFTETESMNTQAGLNFGKKTSGTVTLIGEIASSPASCHYIQTSKVASKSGAGTHHGKTAKDTITAMRDDVTKELGFTNEKSVEHMVADAIDFDIHMDREEGFRYNERITQITALKMEEYPFEDYKNLENLIMKAEETGGKSPLEIAEMINRQEYWKRRTDRPTFETKNICEFDKEANRYVLTNMFSDEYVKRICKNLSKKDVEQFNKDMDKLERINKGIYYDAIVC